MRVLLFVLTLYSTVLSFSFSVAMNKKLLIPSYRNTNLKIDFKSSFVFLNCDTGIQEERKSLLVYELRAIFEEKGVLPKTDAWLVVEQRKKRLNFFEIAKKELHNGESCETAFGRAVVRVNDGEECKNYSLDRIYNSNFFARVSILTTLKKYEIEEDFDKLSPKERTKYSLIETLKDYDRFEKACEVLAKEYEKKHGQNKKNKKKIKKKKNKNEELDIVNRTIPKIKKAFLKMEGDLNKRYGC